jgi:hypothetical protein
MLAASLLVVKGEPTMSRVEQKLAARGSQKWLQILVNERPELVEETLATSLGLTEGEHIRWLSPLKADDYAEYRDVAFINRLGIELEKVSLASFWPRFGPVWDGLAKTDRGDVILVEAKAHISELVSDPTGASGSSLDKIRRSLGEAKQFLHSHPKADWATCFYQYTNRLAHLYLLRELNSLPAYLLFIYFINDKEMGGPSTRSEWEGAICLLESFLDIREHRLSCAVLRAYIDTRQLEPVGNYQSAQKEQS